MFRRVFWFTTGAAAGVWATTRVQRKLRSLAPESLAVRAAGRAVDTGHRLRHFALDVRDGMATREAELYDALGLSRGDLDPEGFTTIPARPLPRPGKQQPGRSHGANGQHEPPGFSGRAREVGQSGNPPNPGGSAHPGQLGKEDH